MAVILAYGSPSLGHLFPVSALLHELAGRGHRVHLRTMAAEVVRMRKAGFVTKPVDPRIEAISGQDWLAHNALEVPKVSLDVLCRRTVHEVDDLKTAIAPYDPMCSSSTRTAGARYRSPMPATFRGWCFHRSPLFAFSRRAAVRTGPATAARCARRRPRRVDAPVVRYLFDRRMLPHVNTIRAGLGVPRVESVDEFFRRVPLLLAVGGEPFEYPHPGWGDTVHLIGAYVFEPTPASAPSWLAAIDRPIVLVSTSSIKQADDVLGRSALAALADEPVHVVATFPAGVPANLPRPANATVCRFAPHSMALERAVCAVTHGGMGVTVKALDRGVPVCVVPFARDQAEVPRRVQVARAASGCRRRSSPPRGYGQKCARR